VDVALEEGVTSVNLTREGKRRERGKKKEERNQRRKMRLRERE